ncbi:MAG TPA: hypothetical protein DDY58_19585 [Terrisporobacter glycolicus]|uniref:hypothetical protein n=1 Tax=Terrisporobacter TaxID=1505652 RepID=UPI000E85CFF3|nr:MULTISPECIES: hypothetical protein [Terrisporobacter]HBI94449.1 hypothetical protein [Terrisporobacter hibernicus]
MNLAKDIICNTKDVSAEYLELGIDALSQEKVIKDIPVVSTIMSIFRVGGSIKQAFFCKKLINFLYNMNDISLSERQKFYDKSIKDDIDFGEKLIYTLDSLDEVKKAEYLAKLYKAYSDGKINYQEFRRLCIALIQLFIDDIEYIKNNANREIILGVIGRALNSVGLARKLTVVESDEFDAGDKEPFYCTTLAFKLKECLEN